MDARESIVRGSAWAALGLAAAAYLLRSRQGMARAVWSAGCGCFLLHVASAFALVHGWSHADAYAATERQTAVSTGVRWGGGLYLNYLFATVWLADVVWSWASPRTRAAVPRRLVAGWYGFFVFMAFNATVVFGSGTARVYGLVLGGAVVLSWWRSTSSAQARA